ncbi:MAG: hypothetical protein ACLFPL_03780 [Candidatus Nanoarchaeia archaeon]
MDVSYINNAKDLKVLFEKTLTNNEKMMRTALSHKPLIYLVGQDYADEYMNKRREQQILLKSLRFYSQNNDKAKHKKYDFYLKEVKQSPKQATIDYSLIIWDDTVAIIDTNSLSGTIIKDTKYSKTMKQWFDIIWDESS